MSFRESVFSQENLYAFIAVIVIIAVALGVYYGTKEDFTNMIKNEAAKQMKKMKRKMQKGNRQFKNDYNALYNSDDSSMFGAYKYTQPPGNTLAQESAGSGQGTQGGFLPLQGIGAGVYMKNSTNDNLISPVSRKGEIGGQPNYTEQKYSNRWVGFNNFGHPYDEQKGPDVQNVDFTNSYLVNGNNTRVINSGQKGSAGLHCQDWYPHIKKNSAGFCVQGSDAIATCESGNLKKCNKEDLTRFLNTQMLPQYTQV